MVRTLLFLLSTGVAAYASGTPELLSQIHSGNHAEVVKLLHSGADVNMADADGTTALMHAVIESDASMVKLLIDAGAACKHDERSGFNGGNVRGYQSGRRPNSSLPAGADANAKNKRGATADDAWPSLPTAPRLC